MILDDEEPIEDWLSVRSKCRNICKGQEPSSMGSGGEDGDGGESGGNESVGVESVSWKGSKAKRSRLIVPLHRTTPQVKWTGETDIPWDEFREQGADKRIRDGVSLNVSNVRENSNKGEKWCN